MVNISEIYLTQRVRNGLFHEISGTKSARYETFTDHPWFSSTTVLTTVALWELKGWCYKRGGKYAQTVDLPASSLLCGKCSTIAALQFSTVKCRITKKKLNGGFFPPKMRHEHVTFCCSCCEHIRGPSQSIPQRQQANGRYFGTQALFFSLASEVVYMAQSRRPGILSHQSLSFQIFLRYRFVCSYFISYMLDGHAYCPCLMGSYCIYRVQR